MGSDVYVVGPPIVQTDVAGFAVPGVVTLRGGVNPDAGRVTDCYFEFGPTTAYGERIPCAPSPGAGEATVETSAAVAGLVAGDTYHYRVVATSLGGTTYGGDRAFTTAGAPDFGRCWRVPAAKRAPKRSIGGALRPHPAKRRVLLTMASTNGQRVCAGQMSRSVLEPSSWKRRQRTQ